MSSSPAPARPALGPEGTPGPCFPEASRHGLPTLVLGSRAGRGLEHRWGSGVVRIPGHKGLKALRGRVWRRVQAWGRGSSPLSTRHPGEGL